jgi:hypothetical protein
MSRFREEMQVIPRGAWIVALLLCGGLEAVLWFVAFRQDPEMLAWPPFARVMFAVVMVAIVFVYILLIGYVNGDARRRGMRYVLWTVLSALIPDGIGIILYFILRDPRPHPCPKCGAAVNSKFPFCPACGAAQTQTCPGCRQAVEPGWSHCARCGAGLKAA